MKKDICGWDHRIIQESLRTASCDLEKWLAWGAKQKAPSVAILADKKCAAKIFALSFVAKPKTNKTKFNDEDNDADYDEDNSMDYNEDVQDSSNSLDVQEKETDLSSHDYFIAALALKSLEVIEIASDGNCLFRSFSHQVYGSDEHHELVREYCMDYMTENSAFFADFISTVENLDKMEAFAKYVVNMRKLKSWGDHLEIQVCRIVYTIICFYYS